MTDDTRRQRKQRLPCTLLIHALHIVLKYQTVPLPLAFYGRPLSSSIIPRRRSGAYQRLRLLFDEGSHSPPLGLQSPVPSYTRDPPVLHTSCCDTTQSAFIHLNLRPNTFPPSEPSSDDNAPRPCRSPPFLVISTPRTSCRMDN